MTRTVLFKLWSARDARYALARKPGTHLTEREVSSIRAYRLREVELLEKDQDRQVAIDRLATWRPPLSELL